MATEKPKLEEKKDMAKAKQDIAAFMQGFLEATDVGEFNYTNLLECIYVLDNAAIALYYNIFEWKLLISNPGMADVVGIIMTGIAVLSFVKESLPYCENIDSQPMNWTSFDQICEVAESPYKHMSVIEKDVIFNGVEITEDLTIALESLKSENYKDFGFQVGQVMHLATENPEQLPHHMYLF